MTTTATPWAVLPPALGDALRDHLAEVVDEVIAAVGNDVAEYQRPLEGSFGTGVRVGVSVALGRFLELPGTTQAALSAEDREVYVGLGRGEVRQQRTMASLLAAYRAGARVALRRFAALAGDKALDPELLLPLAEAIFVYIDELSAASVEGYAAEQAERAGERERHRSELLGAVLTGTTDPTALADRAAALGWRPPDQVLALVVTGDRMAGLTTRLGPEALVGERGERQVAVLPAPRRATDRLRLGQELAGVGAVVGVGVPLGKAPLSLRTAELAARLVDDGVLTGDPVWSDEHLPMLIVRRDEELLGLLRREVLAPLEGVKPATAERLAETLRSWLAHRGERARIAAELHVHPQTVGYRLGQLREAFGDALDDPAARFALELALRGG